MPWGLLLLFAVALLLLILIGTVVLVYVLAHPPRRTVGVAIARGEPTNPIEAGAKSYETHHLRLADRCELELWDVPGHNPRGPTIIMFHGWGDGRLGELLWLDVLMPIASRLILFDMRGHGECRAGRCAWGLNEVEDALAVIDWAGGCGIGNPECEVGAPDIGHSAYRAPHPVVLFGYSMGAAIAIAAAVRAGPRVSAVIADSPYRSMAQAVRGTMRLNRLPTWPLVPLGLAWLRWHRGAPAEDDLSLTASKLAAPLLVLHGGADAIAPSRDARHLAAAAPRAQLVEFASCGHLGGACAEPERYARTVHEFLRD